jgi:hypothetical protein
MGRDRRLLTIAIGLLVPVVLSAQWEPDVRLTNDPFESITSFDNAWCVASFGANVHVVWHDNRDGNTEIYYKRSTDNGTTWEMDTRITDNVAWSERPSVAVCDSIIHVVWYDGRLGPPRIFYKRSLDYGTTWGSDISLTPSVGVAYHPSVAIADSIVHVVWTDMSAGPQIYYTRSLDNGTTWEAERIITPSAPPAGKNLASVAVSDSIVHVTWMDMRADPRIYYTRSLDNGTTWELDRSITSTTSQFASVAVSDSIVHVVYADFRFGPDVPKIYYIRSLDDGTTWGAETMLADDSASWYPSVAVSGSCVHAVWPDNRNGDPSEIYYRRSVDNGTSWDADIRLTDNVSESREPSVAVCGSHVHVVWHDNRDGNWEIYYKRNPTGNPTGAPEILSVTDIPNDQGRWVRVTWAASMLDQPGSVNPITQYGVWRRIDEYDMRLSHQERNSIFVTGIEDSLEGWDAVGTVPAIQDSLYNFVSPTLADSNASGIYYSVFLITAHTQDPFVWFASEPDSGYSIDNIPPETPYDLTGEVIGSDVLLTWQIQLNYPDFSHFAVYRDTASGFTPGEVNRIGTCVVSSYTDTSVVTGTYYYVVSALDVNGNEGGYSNEVEVIVTGIEEIGAGVPAVCALSQSHPNPFKTETAIHYQLSQPGAVTIAIYNVSGQRMKTLINDNMDAGYHVVHWDGRSQDGQRVGNGVYFCQMVSGEYTSVRKILLTR